MFDCRGHESWNLSVCHIISASPNAREGGAREKIGDEKKAKKGPVRNVKQVRRAQRLFLSLSVIECARALRRAVIVASRARDRSPYWFEKKGEDDYFVVAVVSRGRGKCAGPAVDGPGEVTAVPNSPWRRPR